MSKRAIDTSLWFSLIDYEKLPDEREIEDPDFDPVPESKPVLKAVQKELYLPDDKLKEAVDLAIALGRPLLLQGEPGCGKTRLAYAVAYALGLPLEASYIKSTSRAQDLLYTYDAVNRLYDAEIGEARSRDVQQYIRLGPLGRAIARAQYGRRSENQISSDSPMVRLSFRDILWYCYLDQDNLDSSFYRLEEPVVLSKSRNVMRFLAGYYTERLNELEINLADVKKERLGKKEAITQIRSFLEQFGYGSETEIRNEIEQIQQELSEAKSAQSSVRQGYMADTHFADELRHRLRQLSHFLADEEQALEDLSEKINEREALKAELISAKLKVSRANSAVTLLSGVSFESCPACGTSTEQPCYIEEGTCYLCGRHSVKTPEQTLRQNEVIKQDLVSRISELEEFISAHKQAIKSQERRITRLQQEKDQLDAQLRQELVNYDSAFLARSREVDRRVATLEERIRGLQKIETMISGISRLERDVHELGATEEELEEQIQTEKASLTNADQNIRDIESAYLEALLSVGIPGVNPNDKILLDRKSWLPWILANGDDALKWNFSNAGSGGKKTLLKVCYALALHKVASENNLPLPTYHRYSNEKYW